MVALIIFIILTILLYIGKYYTPHHFKIMIGVYLVMLFTTRLYFNSTLLNTVCEGSKSSLGTVLYATIIPWLFIGGGITVALNMFPGWKQPFSNTFGYGITKLAGIDTLINDIISKLGGKENNKTLVDNIYKNPSLFINELTTENMENFEALKLTFGTTINETMYTGDMFKKFKNLIRLKEIVSECVWQILSGILVGTVSYNTIVSSSCNNSVKEMKKRHDEYNENVIKNEKQKITETPQRIYKITD